MQTALIPKKLSDLEIVDLTHRVDITKYFVPGTSLESLQHNSSLRGFAEPRFIREAEIQGLRHEYDIELDATTTKAACYLLLKKLYDRGLAKCSVYLDCVAKIASLCTSFNDFSELHHAVSCDATMISVIEARRACFAARTAA